MKGLLVSSIIFFIILICGASHSYGEKNAPVPPYRTGPLTVTDPLHKKFLSHTTIGNRYYGEREYDRALYEYYAALKYHRKMLSRCKRQGSCGNSRGYRERNFTTHLLIGRTLSAIGDYDGAITNFDIVIGLYPDDYRGYYERALTRALLGDRESAISDYNTVIELDPKNGSHYIKRAYIFLENGDYGRALDDYTLVIEIEPEETRAYSGRGELYFKHFGDRRRACSDWEVSCELGECSNYDRAKREGICE